MIKKIHYCWFGNSEKPKDVRLYIKKWTELMPEFELYEWNEDNSNFRQCDFASQAYFFKKYAFVSDYVRMKVLYEYGGLYLDTDIKMIKSLAPLCSTGDFIGIECDGCYGTGIMYAEPKASWVKRMIDFYETHSFVKIGGLLLVTPNTHLLTNFYPNQSIGINVLPYDYLTAKSWKTGQISITSNTYCVHDYAKTWLKKGEKTHGLKYRLINSCKFFLWWLDTKILYMK